MAERALPYAESVARATRARVILLMAANAPALVGVTTVREEMRVVREATRYLEAVASRLVAGGVIENAVFQGDPGDAIVEENRLRGVDLVVMATHGRSGLERLVAGSVAEKVLRRGGVPVLLVRVGAEGPAVAPLPPRPRVLVSLDGSPFAEAALPIAGELARMLQGDLALMQSVPMPEGAQTNHHGRVLAYLDQRVESLEAEARAYLRSVADRLVAEGMAAPLVEVRVGPPGETIVAASRELGAGLVAMATHGRGAVGRLVMGSVADQVLRTSSVPLLLTRPNGLPAEP